MKKLVKKALAIVLFVTIIASSSISTMAAPAKKNNFRNITIRWHRKILFQKC